MDKDTKRALRESSELEHLVKSDGWAIARQKIFNKIVELNDITSITEFDPNKLIVIIAAKQEAVKILFEWLTEIEGIAKGNKDLHKQMLEQQKHDFIMTFEPSERE